MTAPPLARFVLTTGGGRRVFLPDVRADNEWLHLLVSKTNCVRCDSWDSRFLMPFALLCGDCFRANKAVAGPDWRPAHAHFWYATWLALAPSELLQPLLLAWLGRRA